MNVAQTAEVRLQMEQTKKDIRQLKAMEAQVNWNMRREEKREVIDEEKATDTEIRDWRWQQKAEMKQYEQEQARQTKIEDLVRNKDAVDWKREVKQVQKQDELVRQTEEYYETVDNAAWKEAVEQAVVEDRRAEVAAHVERFEHSRALKELEKQRKQEEVVVERQWASQQTLQHAQGELQRQKEQLQRTLEFSQRCAQSRPVTVGLRAAPRY